MQLGGGPCNLLIVVLRSLLLTWEEMASGHWLLCPHADGDRMGTHGAAGRFAFDALWSLGHQVRRGWLTLCAARSRSALHFLSVRRLVVAARCLRWSVELAPIPKSRRRARGSVTAMPGAGEPRESLLNDRCHRGAGELRRPRDAVVTAASGGS
jgi:hypothetical protein